jgi:enoyl-CoA hydratase/carnithine racemase
MSVTQLADGALRVETGPVARITLHAPRRRNAISQVMWRALPSACAQVADARAVIVTGAEGHFSAGADIGEFETIYPGAPTPPSARASRRWPTSPVR